MKKHKNYNFYAQLFPVGFALQIKIKVLQLNTRRCKHDLTSIIMTLTYSQLPWNNLNVYNFTICSSCAIKSDFTCENESLKFWYFNKAIQCSRLVIKMAHQSLKTMFTFINTLIVTIIIIKSFSRHWIQSRGIIG